MLRTNDDYCFQGSTEFYDSPQTDEFTPSSDQAISLEDSIGRRKDGSIPPWIDEASTKSPWEQYVEWFNGIWHTGDPSSWGPQCFINQAVMIDPTGISTGAKQAAAGFLLLFKYFPELRGEVVSWAANDREIFINWRFEILQKESKTPLLVPVVDKFCFVDGRVSFRLAYFDIITLMGYLSENFGSAQLVDYVMDSMVHAETTGGIQFLPRVLWNLIKGLFFWPAPATQTGLCAVAGDGFVRLKWKPIECASYKVSRATDLAGPYSQLPLDRTDEQQIRTNYYDDREVTNGTTYWYLVSPNFEKWKPTAVNKESTKRLEKSRGARRQRAVSAGSFL